MKWEDLDAYIERLENAYETTIRKIGNEISEDSKELGLTRAQYYILFLLSKRTYYTSSELAEKLEVKPSAVTVMIDRLLKTNLVKRERDKNDRRIIKIKITTDGEKILHRVKQKRKEVLKRYFIQLEDKELESLLSIFEKLAKLAREDK